MTPCRLLNGKGESVGLSYLEGRHHRHKQRDGRRRGNHYFPPSAVDFGLLEMSPHTSVCPIKGAARYFHVRGGDALNANAA